MTTQNTPGDGSHPDIPGSNNGPTIGPIAVRRRSTWLSPAHRYRVHPAWPQEGGPGPNLPLRGPLKSIRGAVPKQQPRERERGSSYSARRDNVDNAMPTVRTMTCTHITWVVMVHMKDRQSHAHRLHGLRVVRTDTCPGRVECDRRRTKCELCAKCAGQGDRRMLCVTGLPGAAPSCRPSSTETRQGASSSIVCTTVTDHARPLRRRAAPNQRQSSCIQASQSISVV